MWASYLFQAADIHWLGKKLPDHIKTIAIPIFVNKTLQDGVEEIITQQVIEQFVKGGKVRLVSEDNADAILRGTITAYKSDDVASYDEYNEVASYNLKVSLILNCKT